MTTFVVDASVVVKWFVPEVRSDAARRLLSLPHHYAAPDLLFAEIANTIWKKVRRGELAPADGRRLVRDVAHAAVETFPCRALADDAYDIAVAAGCTVYDALYLALAARLDTRMLTADGRLVAMLSGIAPLADHIEPVERFVEHGS